MSLGIVFTGQGGQHPEMLAWLDTEPLRSEALDLLRLTVGSDWRARCNDPAWLALNHIAQPLLTGLSLAAWERVKPLLPTPGAIAGYSVGELAAFCAAGVFDIPAAMDLAARRPVLMDRCVQGIDTAMMSIGGLALAQTEALCQRHGMAIAIRTGPETCIVGGLRSGLDAFEADAVDAGARCGLLAVSLASHTPWMDAAVAPFAQVLAPMIFARPHTPLVCNVGGQIVRDPAELRAALSDQLATPVAWERCMQTLAERGVSCVLEIGPGAMLARLWNARFPQLPARSLDEFRDPTKAAEWVRRSLAIDP